MSESERPVVEKRRSRKWIYWIGGLLVLYIAFGFLGVPRIVESVMTSQVESALEAELNVERVAFNPLTLRLQIEGLELRDAQGETVMLLGKGRFALSLKSIYQFAGVLREVELQQPQVFINRLENGDINLLRLLPEQDTAEPDQRDAEAGLPRLGITRLIIAGGRVEFNDAALAEPFNFGFHPIDFELNDFTTFREEGNQLSFDANDFYGGRLRGEGSFSPSDLTAAIAIELAGLELSAFAPYVSEFVDLNLNQGQMSLNLQASLDAKQESDLIRGILSDFEIRDLKVYPHHRDEALLELDRVALGTLEFGAFDPWVKLDSVRIESGRAHLVLLEDRSPEILSLLPMAEMAEAGTGEAEPSGELELPFELRIDSIQWTDFSLEIEDQSLPDSPRLYASLDKLELRELSHNLDQSIPFDLSGRLFGSGHFGVEGKLAPLPLLADLKFEVTELPFAPLNPWIAEFIELSLTSGSGFARGRIQIEESADAALPQLLFDGEAGVDTIALRHQDEDLASLDSLRIGGIAFNLSKMDVHIERFAVDGPVAEVKRDVEGRLNLLTLVPQTTELESADPQPEQISADPYELPLSWSLAELEVRNGQVGFSDESVSPAFATRTENIQLRLRNIESDPASRGEMQFSARFVEAGTIELEGQTNANPLDLFADLRMTLTGFGLPATSGYSGQFVGRAIAQGRLDLAIDIEIADESLTASNALLVRNLSLGDRVDHPDALSLPLDLAVSLLRNRRGEISLNIPLSGRIDDPQFSIASVASQAFASVIGNIVSSPFSILGNLVGSRAEELSRVTFAPGSAELRDDQREPIADLAQALYQRPALELEVRVQVDRTADREALANAELRRSLRQHYREQHGEEAEIPQNYWENTDLIAGYYEQVFGPLVEESDEPAESAEPPAQRTRRQEEREESRDRDRGLLGRFVDWLRGVETAGDTETADQPVEPVVDAEEIVETESLSEEQPERPDRRVMRNRLLQRIEISEDQLMELGQERAESLRKAFLQSDQVEAERLHFSAVEIGSEAKAEFDVR